VKNIGKPCTGKPYARFDEGEQANLIMHRLVRHRQTKEADTDRLVLRAKGLFSTLPSLFLKAGVDLEVIQDILNHHSQSVTLRYIGINREDRDSVYPTLKP